MDYREYSAEDFALDEKFQKWVLGTDSDVTTFWEQWIKENPDQRQNVDTAFELVHAAGLTADSRLNEAYLSAWAKLQENVVQTKQARRNTGFRYAKIAAVFIGLMAISFVLLRQFTSEEVVEYRTAYGEVNEFVLQDGSKVTLNSNSLLTVKGDWNERDAREVFLEGEGFFEVKQTPDHKRFEVNTRDEVHVQVLGTEFNVNTRRQQVEVYLQSGKVKVNSLAGTAVLKPGDFVVYQKGDQELVVKQNATAEIEDVLSWKSNFFVFNDTPLSEVVEELEDSYGFTVVMQEKLLSQRKITARISRKDVDVLFDVLSETLGIRIARSNNQLTITDSR